jgi:16S rRNA (adenine1518-N6/adenine1519-N6)-dimethyltransferase
MNVKTILREYDFKPKKRWGQSFLVSEKIRDKIIELSAIKPEDIVLEIGPGLGILTGELIRCAKKVIAVEKDERLCQILRDLFGSHPNLKIICNDILKLNLSDLMFPDKKLKVVANLPYYITSPVIFHLFRAGNFIDSILLTVQKEVGQRLLARPGTRDYSAISVNVRFYSQPSSYGVIKKDAFYPRPRVDGSIIKLNLFKRPVIDVDKQEKFLRLVREAFAEKRKTILNSLTDSRYFGLTKKQWLDIFRKSQLDPARRAETFRLEEFTRLFNNLG